LRIRPCPPPLAAVLAAAALGLALALGGCVTGPGHRPPEPELLDLVRSHYRDFAIEQGGACQSPVMADLLETTVEARSGQRIILRVRYTYRQAAGSADAAACRGTGERVFRIERRGAGWQVVQMSGRGRLGPGGLFRFPFW
jgi:hypothetical protein